MDFIAEEELCQQAYEVWLSYACPACGGSSQPAKCLPSHSFSSEHDGPCSALPLVVFSALHARDVAAGSHVRL